MKNALILIALAAPSVLLAQEEAGEGSAPAAAPQEKKTDEWESEELCAARELLYAQDFEAAERAFRRMVDEDRENGPAWFFLGYSLHMLERLDEALDVHVTASRFEKHRPAALYNAGCACALLGRKEEAFGWIDRAFAAGFDNRDLVLRDKDLDSLRKDPRFAAYLPVEKPCKPFLGDVRVLHTFVGEAAGDQFGWEGRNAGDCDADGKSDILLSAPYQSAEGINAGRIYVFSGASGEMLFSRSGRPWENLGIGIGAAGDVNGDGHADVIAGATNGKKPGQAYVISGADGETLLELRVDDGDDSFGWKVAGVGDMDGDGHPDVAVGAPGSDRSGRDAGSVYVFSGHDGDLLLSVGGERAGDEAGTSIAGSCDGERKLLAVGACNAGPGRRGRVTVYEIENRRAQRVFTIEAGDKGQNLGKMFLSFVGDVDADGHLDVYASDWENNARGRATGRVYVHSGRTGERLLTLTGEHAGDGFGTGTARAGDVNGDGHDDLIIGAWRNAQGAPSGGKAYVYSGADGTLLGQYVSTTPGDTFGFDAVGMGDLDGDGGQDYLITSAWSHAVGKRTGRAFVIAGTPPTRLVTPVRATEAAGPQRPTKRD